MTYISQISNINSTLNSTTLSSVTGGEVFTGTGEDVTKYGTASISIWSPFAQPTAGTLTIEVSRDGVNYSGPTRRFEATNTAQPHMWTIAEQYFRIVYTVDAAQTADSIVIQTQYSVNRPIQLGHSLDEIPLAEHEAIMVKSVGIGATPSGTYSNVKANGLGFSTSTNLTAGEVYQTDVLDLQGYTQVETHIQTDADGTLTFEFLSDPSTVIRTLFVPYVGPAFKTLAAPAFTPYVRYSFTAATSSSVFYYDTKFTATSINGQILALDDFLSPAMVANLGRNVIAGKKPGVNNLYSNVALDSESRIQTDIPKTGFGELRISESTPVIQVSFPYSTINSKVWTQTLSGTASIVSSNSVVSVSAGGANSFSQLNTIRSVKYRSGEGVDVKFAGFFSSPVFGSRQEIGIGNATDGFFFCTSGDQFAINRRSGGVDNITLQEDWNIDAASGVQSLPVMDFTKGNVFEIDYQWLGFGSIVYKIEDPASGDFFPVHRDGYANTSVVPSVNNPTLPIRLYSENTTNTTPIVVNASSLGAFIEGKSIVLGPEFAAANEQASTGAVEVFVGSIKNKTTYSGATNNTAVRVDSIDIVNSHATRPASIRLYKNGATPSLSYTDTNTLDSVVQYASGGTFTAQPSALARFTSVGAGAAITVKLDDAYLYPGENYVVTSALNGAGTDNMLVGFTWKEDL